MCAEEGKGTSCSQGRPLWDGGSSRGAAECPPALHCHCVPESCPGPRCSATTVTPGPSVSPSVPTVGAGEDELNCPHLVLHRETVREGCRAQGGAARGGAPAWGGTAAWGHILPRLLSPSRRNR